MELVATSTMTLEAYITFEETSETRHEFIDGQLYELPETTDAHNDIYSSLTQNSFFYLVSTRRCG